MVHISNGSVSFPKVPLSTQVFVFRKTQRNGTGKKCPLKYYGAYCMICYDMEINNFYKEVVNNIMYKYLLQLNKLVISCQFCLALQISNPFQLNCEKPENLINIGHLIKIIDTLICLKNSSLRCHFYWFCSTLQITNGHKNTTEDRRKGNHDCNIVW